MSAIWLLHISSLGDQRKRKHYRNALPGTSAQARGRVSWSMQASGVGERAQVAWDCRTVSPQLLGALLNLLPFTPSGSICLTRASQSGVPGLSFLKVINEFKNVDLSKPAPETWALFIGRAWGFQFPAAPSALVYHQYTPGRKDHPLLPPSQCHCCSPHRLIDSVHNRTKSRLASMYDTHMDCSAWTLTSVSDDEAHVLMGWVFQILDTRHLTDQLPKSQGILT